MSTNKPIMALITDEIVSRIIALTFINLNGNVPVPHMDKVREVVHTTLGDLTMRDGTTFSTIIRGIVATSGDGSVAAIDAALQRDEHARFQIAEIAKALAPIVIQTIRALDEFQTEADDILFNLQEKITRNLTADLTQAPLEIAEVDLGILTDPDRLNTVEAVAEGVIPTDKVYRSHEYRMFAKTIPHAVLNVRERGELSKFLVDHDLYNDTIREALSSDVDNNRLFPDEIRDTKLQADYLSTLWDYGMQLKDITSRLNEDERLSENVQSNINSFITRVALATRWARTVHESYGKNDLIASHDDRNIYVYPNTYAQFKEMGEVDDHDEAIKNFVKSKLIQKVKSPVGGYTINNVFHSRKSAGNVISDYRSQVLLDQKTHTHEVVKKIVSESLQGFDHKWARKIADDLIKNSETTLSDILSAMIERTNDYYLNVFYKATLSQEFTADNPNEARSNVVLTFLATVARDKIVNPTV